MNLRFKNKQLESIHFKVKSLVLFFVFMLCALQYSYAQTTYTWIGATGGSWATAGNWSPTRTSPAATDIMQFNDGATYTVTAVPTQTIRQLLVSNNSNITLQSSAANQTLSIGGLAATANLNITNGSTLILGSSTATFTLAYNTTTTQLGTIAGTLNVNSSNAFTTTFLTTAVTVTGTLQSNGGTVTGSAASLTFGAGGTYVHALNGGTIPTATWNAASNCNITGTTTTNPTWVNTTSFGNITWANTGQTTATGVANVALTYVGNFNVTAGIFADGGLTHVAAAGSQLNIANGATYRTTRTTGFFPTNFNTANLNMNTTGVWDYAATTAHNLPLLPTTYGGTVIISGAAVAKTSAVATTFRNINISFSGATLADGGFQITGNAAGTLTLAAGANLQIGTGGASTSVFPTNYTAVNISLAATSTVTYTTTSSINLSGVPTAYGNLILSGVGSTKTLTASTTVAGNLTINSGTMADGGNTITVNGSITNNGTHSGAGNITIAAGTSLHTISGATSAFGNLIINDGSFATGISGTGTTTVGSLNIQAGTLNLNAFTTGLNITGLTTIGNGTSVASLVYNSSGGTRTFGSGTTGGIVINNNGTFNLTNSLGGPGSTDVSNLTINSGGLFNNTTSTFLFQFTGSLTNNGTISSFVSGSANPGVRLLGTSQTINGIFQITNLSITSGSYTNTGTLTVTTGFSGGGSITQAANSFLNCSATGGIIPTLNATAVPNLVRYFGPAGVPIKPTTYHNLQIDMNAAGIAATGATPGITVNNNLNVSGGIFADGGFQTIGNGTGTLVVANGATIQYGAAGATTTNIPTNYATANITLNPTSTTIYNTTSPVTISATPSIYGHLTLISNSTKTLGAAKTVQGDLTINAGTFADGGLTLTVNGSISNAGSHTGAGRILLAGGASIHNLTGTGSYTNLELNDVNGASAGASFSILGVITQTAGTFTIAAGNTLTLGTGSSLAATGSGNFGGTTTSNLTIAGSGVLGNSIRFASGVQNLGTLNFSRTTSGTTALGSDLNINAALQLSGAASVTTLLNIGSFNITMDVTATFTAPSVAFGATNMIIADGSGELRKTFAAATPLTFTFPVGETTGTTEFSPISLVNFTATGGTKTIGIKVVDAVHPQMTSNGAQPNHISRYWSFSESGPATSYTYAANSFVQYINNASDVVGTLSTATAQLNRYDNGTSTWFQLNSTLGTAQYLTANPFNDVTGKLGGNDFTVRFNPSQTYTWTATSGSGNWTTATNWTPTRTTPANNDFLQFINGGTPTATNVPSETIADLLISGNTDVTLTSVAAAQTLTIAGTTGSTFDVTSGSTLRLSSTLANSTVIAFSGTNVTNIAGTIVLNTNTSNNNTLNFGTLTAANNTITGTITNNGGVVTATTATTTFGASAIYNHAMSGGVVPLANWNTTSNCNITGATTPATFTGVFGNLTINTSGTATLSAASTVAGNLTVTAGTFSDGSTQITGNATGTLSVANGATLQIGNGGTGTTMPTFNSYTFTGGAPGSTVIYGSSSNQSVAGLSYYNLTFQSNSTKTALDTLTVNNNLTINASTFADGGFQVTGNGTGLLSITGGASGVLILGTTTGIGTAFPTGFTTGNINIASGCIVRYNSNSNQNISNVPTYSVLQVQSGGGTPTKTLQGNTNLTVGAASLFVGANNTFNLGGNNLTINSSVVSPITNTLSGGVISANTDGGSTIILAGTTGYNFAPAVSPGTIAPSARFNLTASTSGGVTQGTSFNVFNFSITTGTYTIPSGAVLGIAGTYGNAGTLSANNGATGGLNFNSTTAPQSFTVGTYAGSNLGLLQISNTGGGVSLGSALSATQLTLTSGILTTTGTFLLTVSGTTAGNVSGGSATSYVNGPLVRSLPASASGNNYTFPVGKTSFNTFDLLNPTTTLATTVRVEAFDAAAGGTDGLGFSSSPTPNRYWQASVPTGALTSSGTIRLLDVSLTVDGNTVVGNSATLTGTYAPLGGTNPNSPSSGYITSAATAPIALGFFKMGTRGCLSGTYTVGATGQFTNITSAVSTLNGSQVCGNIIFELQTNYVGTSGETFPITFNSANYSGGPWNIQVRPAAGVSSTLTTSGSSTTQIFSFNGIDRLTFDGRPGGTGTTIRWVIANTNVSATGQVIAFNNDATSDTLEYVQIEGTNLTTLGTAAYTVSGLVAFGNTAVSVGNENNVIDNCVIRAGATIPINAIYSYGSSTANLGNDNNSITNCSFQNIWSPSASSSFINLQTGNSGWNISGNSLFQSTSRTGTTGGITHTGILISNTSGNGFTINNNFIGGTAANAGSTPWTQNGIFDHRFNGMTISVGSTTATNIQGNTIGNISWASNGTATVNSAMFHAIYITNGVVNIGTTTGNVIGNSTFPITITFNNITANQAGTAYGIYNNSGNGQINIQNNTISYITGSISSTTSLNFSAIVFGQGSGSTPSRIINGNTISNITIAGSSGSAGISNLYGIAFSSGSSAAGEIKNNNIFSITNNYSGSAASQVVGIQIPTTPNAFTITGNTIYSLSSAATHISTASLAAAIGISYTSSISSGHIISNNTIHSLSAGAAAVAANVIGIFYSPALSGSGSIDGNSIHSLSLNTSSASGSINGIYLNQGTVTVSNNMVRLGINAAGSSLTVGYVINGINEIATLNNFYSNSVYIGGTGVASSTSPTYALLSAGTGTRAIQNNIFWNARSNAAGTAKHYAIRYASATGLTSSYNDLLANGIGAVLGNIGGTDNSTLSALSTNSISSDPMFINATGNAASVDLHIQPSPTATPIEGVGVATPALIDFDGQTRTSFTAEDIGADAGNFTPIDLTPPSIVYTPFSAVCNTVTTYNVSATITDSGPGSSVNTASLTKPRLYFKKFTDANTLAGWKFVEATNAVSPYTFDIDFSLIGGVNPGNNIQYFIVAQDQGVNVPTPNVGINSGTFTAAPSSVALTSAAFPIGGTINSFIVSPCSGTITVGTGGNYLTLTNAGGVFEAINATTLTGNLTVNIISNITTEDGTNALNQFVAPNTVTIQSDGTAWTISGSYSGAALGLFRLNGADRVIFNGGTTTQRMLTFRNTNTSAQNATFVLANDASSNQLNNLIIEGGATSTFASGVVLIGSGTAIGNDNNTIIRCDVRGLTTSASFPLTGIYMAGTSASVANDNNVIQDNNIFDFYSNSSTSYGIRIETFNGITSISGNSIYQATARGATGQDQFGISINTVTGVVSVDNNKIGGSGANLTGTWSVSASPIAPSTYRFAAIYQLTAPSGGHQITNNQIGNIIAQTSSGGATNYGSFCGICIAANSATIVGNTLGNDAVDATSAASIDFRSSANGTNIYGIRNVGTGTITLTNNKVAGINYRNATASVANTGLIFTGISATAGTVNASGNTIGSTSIANSIVMDGINSTTNSVNMFGFNIASANNHTITNNTVSGLVNSGLTSSGITIGINLSGGGQFTVNNNILHTIRGAGTQSTTGSSAVVAGISLVTSNSQASFINNNIIYNLISNGSGSPGAAIGITYNGGTGTSNTINGNFIHSFNHTSAGSGAQHIGVEIVSGSGAVTVSNNMLRLGRLADGSAFNSNISITGILDASTSAQNFWHNTVFIDGAPTGGSSAQNSYVFRRSAASGADFIQNNIFANNRTGGFAGSLHFAFATNTTAGFTAASLNSNVYMSAANTEFSLAATPANFSAAATPALRMQALRAAAPTGNNLRSGIATLSQINFINTNGNTASVNLRLNNANCAASAGIPLLGITSDFDGTITRSATAPAIGAHESAAFNTIATGYDIYTPVISVSSVPNLTVACGTSQTVTITATVTDVGLGLASGALQPTLWWRLSTGSYASLAPSSSAGNTFTYTLNLSGIAAGQIYHYYVAAQDIESPANIFYSNFNAATPVHSDVSTLVTPNTNPNTFSIISATPLSGTVTVAATGANYSSFSKSGGVFSAIGANGLSGNLIISVTGDISTEDGTFPLALWTEYCGSGYTVTIQPSAATVRTISGASFTEMIQIKAPRVIIDGRFNGSGRFLKFVNTQTGGSQDVTISFSSNASNDTLRYCDISSNNNANSTADGVILFSGVNNIVVDNNLIHGGPATGYSNNIITAFGNNSSNITITNNEIYNFLQFSGGTSTRSNGIRILSPNGSNWTITGNSIYNNGINGQNVQTAIDFSPGSASTGNIISNNYIGGSAAQTSGSSGIGYWGNSYGAGSTENILYGININAGTVTIDGNNFARIYQSSCDYAGIRLIYIAGSSVATVTNNIFGVGSNGTPSGSPNFPSSTNGTIYTSGGGCTTNRPGYIYGIWNASTTTSMSTYSGNYFYYLTQAGAGEGGSVQCIFHNTAGPATITNNSINGPQASGAGSIGAQAWNSFGIRLETTGSTSGNLIKGNLIAGPFVNSYNTLNYGASNFGIRVLIPGTSTVSGTIERNVIWDMRNADYQAITEAIYVYSNATGGNGSWDIYNNQISLRNNGGTSNCVSMYGIDLGLNSSSISNVNYNTVYIGGSNGGGTPAGTDFSSYAFFRNPNNSSGSNGGATTLNNNIFINNRLASTAAVTCHCAIANVSSSPSTGWNVSDYNFLFTSNGSKSRIGQWGTSTTYSTLGTWQGASSKDANSFTATVTTGSSNYGSNILNPDNLFSNPLSDLHISSTDGQSYLFVNNRATPIAITTDFDSDVRDATNPDIGADEFGTVNDAGVIAIKPNCSGTQVDVTIKNYGSAVLNSVTVNWTVNGVSQTAGNFTAMNLASGATVVRTINLSSPTSWTAGTAYNVVATTSLPNGLTDEKTSNDSYTANPLYYGLGSTVYIGTGSPSFSTYSALFNALNNTVLTANLSVIVNANSSEPATPVFLNAVGYCGGTRTITITPSSGTVYTATGTSGTSTDQGMIGFNGAANVTIDGNSGGSGQYLRFRNTNSVRPVIAFKNDANAITIKNAVIEGNNSTTYISGGISNAPGIIFLGDAATSGTGNRNIIISNNTIRDRSDVTGVPANAIFSFNSTAGTTNNAIKIKNNDIFNFSQTGVYLPDAAGNGTAWNISSNNFYCTSDLSAYQSSVPQHIAIYLKASTSHTDTIKYNFIGGSAAGATGTWNNSNNVLNFEGIRLEIGGTSAGQTSLVDSNTVRNINLSGTSLSGFYGIRVRTGLVNIRGNVIGDLSATISSPSILVAGSGTANGTNDFVSVFGIWNYSTNPTTVSGNLVAGIKNTGGYAYMTGIRLGAREYGTNSLNIYSGKVTVTGNVVANLYSNTNLSNVYMSGSNMDKVWPGALTAIALRTNNYSGNLVDSNTVYGLRAYGNWNRWVRVNGIALNAESSTIGAGTVSRNRIADLENYNGGNAGSNTFTPSISGFSIGASDLTGINLIANGSFTLINNMIYLAPAVNSGNAYNNPDLYGILDDTKSGNTTRYYYNSIYISGAGKTSLPGDAPVWGSYAFHRCASGDGTTNGGTVYLQNNIFINDRTGVVSNFAIGNQANTPATNFSGSNVNYNLLSTANTNNVAQVITGTGQTGTAYTFAGWKGLAFSPGPDANSKYGQTVTGSTPSVYSNNSATDVVNPNTGYLFVNPNDISTSLSFLHISLTDAVSNLFIKDNGTPVSGITTDFDSEIRSITTPSIGADELVICPPPVITLQPIDKTICPGNTTFDVTATSVSTATYQWQVSTNGGTVWSDLTNTGIYSTVTNPTLTITGATSSVSTFKYRVNVTNACTTLVSNVVTLIVNDVPSITAYNPGPTSAGFVRNICAGSNTSFGVTAVGTALTYAWEVSTNSGTSWATVSNGGAYSTATTSVLNISNVPAIFNGYLYRVTVSGTCTTAVTSAVGTLNVGSVSISTQPPATTNACVGSPQTIAVSATGNNLAYQWAVNTGSGYSNISDGGTYTGTSTATMSITSVNSGMASYQYRVTVSSGACTPVVSTASSISILSPPAITAYNPVSFINTICEGTTTSFTVTATGSGLSYAWEVSSNSGSSWSTVSNGAPYTGATTNSLSISNTPSSLNGYQYRAIVSGTCSPAQTSTIGYLNVSTTPSIVTQPTGESVCKGATSIFSLTATAIGTISYQWEYNNGGTWVAVSNGLPTGITYSNTTTNALSIVTSGSASSATYQYRCRFYTLCNASPSSAWNISNTATLDIRNQPSVSNTGGANVCIGGAGLASILISGGVSPSYQWQYDAGSGFANVANGTPTGITYTGQTTINLSVTTNSSTTPAGNYIYKCLVADAGNGCTPSPSFGNSAINVNSQPVAPGITKSPNSAIVCQGTSVSATFTAGTGGISGLTTDTYEYSTDGGTNWFPYTSGTGISTTSLVGPNIVQIRTQRNATGSGCGNSSYITASWSVQVTGTWIGTTNDWDVTSNWGCGTLPTITTNVVIPTTPEGGNFPVVYSTSTALANNLTLQTGASITVNSTKNLAISGNITNNGTTSFGAGDVILTGTAVQYIGGSTASQFGTLQVNNTPSGTALILNQNMNVSTVLNMLNIAGKLDLNGYTINLGTTGAIVNESNANRIFCSIGTGVIKATRSLSASSTAYNNIAGLGVSITTGAGNLPGVTDITRGHASQQTSVPSATAPNNSIVRYFDIEPTLNTNLDATLKIDYFDDELSANGSVPVEAQLIPYRSENAGTTWEGQHFPARLSNSVAANWVQLTQIPAFSRWTLSDWLTEPLPIELLSFTATPNDVEVELEWVTASEINNDFFTVEKSLDLNSWNKVLVKDGAGNSNFTKTYTDIDKNPFSGLSYYRLKQTDFNGTFAYSEPVAVYFSRKSIVSLNGLFTEQDLLHLNYLSNSTSEAAITVTDIEGRIVLKTNEAASDGLNQFNYPAAHLAPGMYLVTIRQNNQTKVVKVVKL